MAILSVGLSQPGGTPNSGEIETPGLHRMVAWRLAYLVSYEVIWCQWVRNEGIKEGYPHFEIVILPLLAHLA